MDYRQRALFSWSSERQIIQLVRHGHCQRGRQGCSQSSSPIVRRSREREWCRRRPKVDRQSAGAGSLRKTRTNR